MIASALAACGENASGAPEGPGRAADGCAPDIPDGAVEDFPNHDDMRSGGGDVVEVSWGELGATSSGIEVSLTEPEALELAGPVYYLRGEGEAAGIVDVGALDKCVIRRTPPSVTVPTSTWRSSAVSSMCGAATLHCRLWPRTALSALSIPSVSSFDRSAPGSAVTTTVAFVAPSSGDFVVDSVADDGGHVIFSD